MVFWIAVAILAAAVTYAVTLPLLRPADEPVARSEADLAVYKDQLAEVDADLARGTITATEADAARAEISRRLIRKAEPADGVSVPAASARPVNRLFLAASIALPLLSLLAYLQVGEPNLPGRPLSARLQGPIEGASPNDLIARVEARLRAAPDDGEGWNVLGPVYLRMGRFADAANAYSQAMRVLGETPDRLQGFASARIRAENGAVTEDARAALRKAIAADPKRPEPRAWLALAKEQDGDIDGAKADYKALIDEAPAGSKWRSAIEERLAALNGQPDAPPASGAAPTGAPQPPATTPADVGAMSPEQRQAFITQMVDGLAARLKADGRDVAGWLRLIRAYQVMGRKDDALKALSDARAGLAGDATALAQVEALAKELGLNS